MSAAVPLEDRQLGNLVVAQGLCSREKVDECLGFLARLIAEGVTPVPRLGELLARKGYISSDRLDATLRPSGGAARDATAKEVPEEVAAASRDPANLFGKYVKVSKLGRGGMGEVWRGWDRELRRWVALKFLHHADPEQEARFRREAQTAAALNHPNIASVYEVGEKDGRPFIAMRYVAGVTLAAFPRADLRRLVDLVRDAALAVHEAHEQGVVHRDLKPANLMVETPGGKPRVFVMDFGLAKPTAVDSSLSASGQILGTPAYMAPEQARGESARVGPRSDVYALGATLYELLADRLPYDETEVYALLQKIIDEDPPPIRKLNPRVPTDLETIVMKCMDKDPERRYATAHDLADDLTRWLKGEAIRAHPPSAFYLARKFLIRRKGVVIASSLGLAAVALAVALLVPRWLSARADADALKELGELRTRMLVVREWMRQAFRSPREIREAFERENARLSDFISRHPDRPQGLYARAQGRLFLGMLPAAESDVREAIRLEPLFDPAWTLLGRVLMERYALRLYGDLDADQERLVENARPLLEQAGEALRRGARGGTEAWGISRTPEETVQETLAQSFVERYVRNDEAAAAARLKEAHRKDPSEQYCRWLYNWVESPAERKEWLDQAFRIAPHYALAYADRAFERYRAGDPDGSLEDAARALELNPSLAIAHSTRAACWILKREWARCVEDAERAIALDPLLPLAYVNRAAGRLSLGDWEGTVRDCDRALEIDGKIPVAYANRAGARLNREEWDEALRDAERAIALNPRLAIAYVNRGAVRLQFGQWDESLKDLDRALEIDPKLAMAHINRAGALVRKGDLEGAMAAFARAAEIDPRSALTFASRGAARILQGDPDEAIRDCDRALEIDPKLALAWSNRGAARLDREDWAGALADVSRAIELGIRMPETHVVRGLAHHGLKNLDEAIRSLEKALQAAPSGWASRAEVEKILAEWRQERKGS